MHISSDPLRIVHGKRWPAPSDIAGIAPEPRSHAPTIYQLQNVVDQGVNIQ